MSSNEHLVSVVIPAFNCASFIRNAVESVCRQTYSELEIIVINDGSTDNTEEIIKGIKDPRLKYFYTHNEGNYFARNRGLTEAKGEYIAFLDADDIWLENKLELQIKKFQENPELGLCCSGFFIRYSKNNLLYFDKTYIFQKDFDTENGFVEKALKKNFIFTSTLIIKRKCIEHLGLFDVTYQNAMDYEYWLRIAFSYPSFYMTDFLAIKLEHASNISRNKINTYHALLYIFNECFPKFKNDRYYKEQHIEQVKKRISETNYYLGLEYLISGKYTEAIQALQKVNLYSKWFFVNIAILAARYHSKWLVNLIGLYRSYMFQRTLVVVEDTNSQVTIKKEKESAGTRISIKWSVIIPTLNRSQDLQRFLESIYEQTILPFEIIIIDQSIDDKTKDLICEYQSKFSMDNINLIYLKQVEKSSVISRNNGIKIAKGEILSFFDDDVILTKDYFEKIFPYFQDSIVGGVSGNVIIDNPPNGWKYKLRQLLLKFFLISNLDGKMTISGFGYTIYEREIKKIEKVEMLPGCNMNIRRELLLKNKFDEWFTGYSFREDAELSYRLSKEASLLMVPDAKLYHNYSKLNRLDVRNLKIMEIQNYFYIYKKHIRKNFLFDLLFFYSLFGVFTIAFIEFLCNLNYPKKENLIGITIGIFNLMRNQACKITVYK